VYGRFGYSDLKEAAVPGYGVCYAVEPVVKIIRIAVARSALRLPSAVMQSSMAGNSCKGLDEARSCVPLHWNETWCEEMV